MSEKTDPQENSILGALNSEEFDYLAPHLERVTLKCKEVLFELDEKLQYVYFPITTVASLVCPLEDGTSVEVAVVGQEGMLGVSVLMGGSQGLTQATIFSAGFAYRIPVRFFQEALNRSGGRRSGQLQKFLLSYTQSLITQMAQTAACYRRHSVEQQLSRWLLLSLDRIQSNKLEITHELISNMLGVRRESISQAAQILQQAGVIEYRRGCVEIINRLKLETYACECYSIMKKESERFGNDLRAA